MTGRLGNHVKTHPWKIIEIHHKKLGKHQPIPQHQFSQGFCFWGTIPCLHGRGIHCLQAATRWVFNQTTMSPIASDSKFCKQCQLVVSIHLKHIRQIGSFPHKSGWKIELFRFETTTEPNVSWFHHLYAATQHNFTVHCSGDKHLLDSAESRVVSTNRDRW